MEDLNVIKIGGNIIDEEPMLSSFLKKFASVTGKKILVHGGGKMATRMAEKMGIPQQLVDGRRVTDAETLKIVTMVYAGYINKNIVARLQSHQCNATGICGADGNSVLAHKRVSTGTDFGLAGDIDSVNGQWLKSLLDQGLTIVMAPITHNGQGQLLNTNADTMAQEIAKTMSGSFQVKLIYSFEKAGVLMNVEDEQSVIRSLNPASYLELKESKKIFAGMIPKLDNAFAAIREGVKKVIIGKGEDLGNLLNGKSGTTISHE
ncbi:MAG: acetylglutamate kinase [Bacteroidota bacterium]|nr:acetylglutamate kinase [Bacteroidota bacterium]